MAEKNINLFGGDLVKVPGDTLEECVAACRSREGCAAATLVARWGGCYLKRAVGWQRKPLLAAESWVLCPAASSSAQQRQLLGAAGAPRLPAPLAPLGSRRRLAADASTRPLALPPCSYGQQLNFFGSWTANKVGLVTPSRVPGHSPGTVCLFQPAAPGCEHPASPCRLLPLPTCTAEVRRLAGGAAQWQHGRRPVGGAVVPARQCTKAHRRGTPAGGGRCRHRLQDMDGN